MRALKLSRQEIYLLLHAEHERRNRAVVLVLRGLVGLEELLLPPPHDLVRIIPRRLLSRGQRRQLGIQVCDLLRKFLVLPVRRFSVRLHPKQLFALLTKPRQFVRLDLCGFPGRRYAFTRSLNRAILNGHLSPLVRYANWPAVIPGALPGTPFAPGPPGGAINPAG